MAEGGDTAQHEEEEEEFDEGNETADVPAPTYSELKDQGNALFKDGDVDGAVSRWKWALKEALKQSVRQPSADNWKTQLLLRLNLSQGYLKQREWLLASKQSQFVLQHEPENVKALFRLAQALVEMKEYEQAKENLGQLLKIEPSNMAAVKLMKTVEGLEASYEKKCRSVFSKMVHHDVSDDRPLIEWTEEDKDEAFWKKPRLIEELQSGQNRAWIMSLPLTLLHCIERVCHFNPELENIFTVRDSWVVHIIGARGDAEMEATHTAILTHVPHLKKLTLVVVGFMETSDAWGPQLPDANLSPPLVKRLEDGKKLTCRLFKGKYQDFCQKYSKDLQSPNSLLRPDFCLLPNAGMPAYFDDWTPAIVELIQRNLLCFVTGYCGSGVITHDGQTMIPVLEEIGARVVMGMERNVYPVCVKQKEGEALKVWEGYDRPCADYYGPVEKNGVICAFRGIADGKREEDLPRTMSQILAAKKRLTEKNIEVI